MIDMVTKISGLFDQYGPTAIPVFGRWEIKALQDYWDIVFSGGRQKEANVPSEEAGIAKATCQYKDEMNPTIRQNKPGLCKVTRRIV